MKVLHSICQQIWKTHQWSQDWKRSVFILIPKKGNAKECSNYQTIALISHASKVMLKILQDPDIHNDVITHLEPEMLECKVKWALGSITMNKAIGGDEIPVELFQTLRNDAVKVLHSICQQIWKTQQWPQDWKMSVFIPILKKGNAKECSNYCNCTYCINCTVMCI